MIGRPSVQLRARTLEKSHGIVGDRDRVVVSVVAAAATAARSAPTAGDERAQLLEGLLRGRAIARDAHRERCSTTSSGSAETPGTISLTASPWKAVVR